MKFSLLQASFGMANCTIFGISLVLHDVALRTSFPPACLPHRPARDCLTLHTVHRFTSLYFTLYYITLHYITAQHSIAQHVSCLLFIGGRAQI